MSAQKIRLSAAAAQIATALVACIRYSAALDTANWPPNHQDNGKWFLTVLTDYHVNIKGFESTGATSVMVRFDTEFEDCILTPNEDGFLWDGKTHYITSDSNTYNFQFFDANGEAIDPDFKTSWWNDHFDFNDGELSNAVTEVAFSLLTEGEVNRFLNSVLIAHNKEHKAANEARAEKEAAKTA